MKTIERNELNSPDAPGDGWYIIEAGGEHPTEKRLENGESIAFVQRCTPEALARVVEAGVPPEGVPVDKDHLSLQAEHSTEAMGWVRELALCGGDLAARIEWTPPGLELVRGKVYKHFSTVYPSPGEEALRSGSIEPECLIGLALTNQPNNAAGQPPIANSSEAAVQVGSRKLEVGSENSAPPAPSSILQTSNFKPQTSTIPFSPLQGAEEKKQTDKQDTTMQYNPELLAVLGLPETATDDEVLAAVRALKEGADAAAAAEADTLINSEEEKEGVTLDEEEKEDVKEQLLTNRAHGERYLTALCRSKRPAGSAKTEPRRYAGSGKMPTIANRKTAAEEKEMAIANRARQICKEAAARGHRKNIWTAAAEARMEAEGKR